MQTFKAIKTVYGYLPPEVRKILHRISGQSVTEILQQSVRLDMPGYGGGLDNFHKGIIENLIAMHRENILHISQFKYSYPTAGSEEGIREYMSQLALRGVKTIYVLRGDYEGYDEVAKTRGIRTIYLNMEINPRELPRGHWFISNPSARNGNWLPDGFIYDICETGHKVFLDLSYFGSTDTAVLNVMHENIDAVAISFSKPYGLFYQRIGFLFSRNPIVSLSANKWFKCVPSLMIADRIIQELDHESFARKYKEIQRKIVNQTNEEHGTALRPSDTFLLAWMPSSKIRPSHQKKLDPFWRGTNYRFCLTPYFIEHEQKGEKQ